MAIRALTKNGGELRHLIEDRSPRILYWCHDKDNILFFSDYAANLGFREATMTDARMTTADMLLEALQHRATLQAQCAGTAVIFTY